MSHYLVSHYFQCLFYCLHGPLCQADWGRMKRISAHMAYAILQHEAPEEIACKCSVRDNSVWQTQTPLSPTLDTACQSLGAVMFCPRCRVLSTWNAPNGPFPPTVTVQLASTTSPPFLAFWSPKWGTWYFFSLTSKRVSGSKRADLVLLCDINRLLATGWPESDATGRVMMRHPRLTPDTRHHL